MPELAVRLAILLVVCLLTCLLVWSGQRFVERRRQRVLSAMPEVGDIAVERGGLATSSVKVRVLAFSGPNCQQCQRQKVALQRVGEEQGAAITIEYIDAPNSPELTRRYQVLTVPTTVVIDRNGQAHAVNYGFTHTQRLLEQIEAALSLSLTSNA